MLPVEIGLAVGALALAVAAPILRRLGPLDAAASLTLALAVVHGPLLANLPQRVGVVACLALAALAHTLLAGPLRKPGASLGRVALPALGTLVAASALTVAVLQAPAWLAARVSPRWTASLDAASVPLAALLGLLAVLVAASVTAVRFGLRGRRKALEPDRTGRAG